DAEHDQVEHRQSLRRGRVLAQLLRVAPSALLWPELALHAVHALPRDPDGAAQQRLPSQPVVALPILRPDASLIGEPQLDSLPALELRPQQLIRARRPAPSAQRQVRDAALAPRGVKAASDLARGASRRTLGIRAGGQAGHAGAGPGTN